MKFNLKYRNKITGEEKLFYRDEKRNYTAEDGTFMSKMDSFTKWSFVEKIGGHRTRSLVEKRSLSNSTLKEALTTLNALKMSEKINPSEKLENYIDGFEACLKMFGSFNEVNHE